MKKVLWSAYYVCDDLERQQELDECLFQNCLVFDEVHVFLTLEEQERRKKFLKYVPLKVHHVSTEFPLVRHFLESISNYIRETCHDTTALHVLANGDHYIPLYSLELAYEFLQPFLQPIGLALTYYDLHRPLTPVLASIPPNPTNVDLRRQLFDHARLHHNANETHGTWILLSSPSMDVRDHSDVGMYRFGVPGCDNRLNSDLRKMGFTLYNEARNIHTFHNHVSGRFTMSPLEKEQYRALRVCDLNDSHRVLLMW